MDIKNLCVFFFNLLTNYQIFLIHILVQILLTKRYLQALKIITVTVVVSLNSAIRNADKG